MYTKAHDLMGSDLNADLPNFRISSRYVEAHYWHSLMAVTLAYSSGISSFTTAKINGT